MMPVYSASKAAVLGPTRAPGQSSLVTEARPRAALLHSRNRFKLAVFGANVSGGCSVTGSLGLLPDHPAGIHVVRRLKQVRVFSPRAESRCAFVDKASVKFDIELIEAASVEAAPADAPIVTTVARATQAFVNAADVAHGTHINAVGAIRGERPELAQDVFTRCSRATVDDPAAEKELSSELVQAVGANEGWSGNVSLSTVVAAERGREPGDDITVFKAMGMGVSDLALGIELFPRAAARGGLI
jgi:alanine dehydrogenase